MRKLLKVILPPLVGIAAYFVAVRYSSVYFKLKIDEIGEGTLQGFMAYFRYAMPLLLAVAILTQAVIFVPVWNRFVLRSATGKFITFLMLCFICLLLAAGMSYAIWDHTTGVNHLEKLCLFMTAVQIGYWLINSLVLIMLTPQPAKEVETEKESAYQDA
jgi:hypothetical protein